MTLIVGGLLVSLAFGVRFLLNEPGSLPPSCWCGAFAGTKGRQRRKLSDTKGKNPELERKVGLERAARDRKGENNGKSLNMESERRKRISDTSGNRSWWLRLAFPTENADHWNENFSWRVSGFIRKMSPAWMLMKGESVTEVPPQKLPEISIEKTVNDCIIVLVCLRHFCRQPWSWYWHLSNTLALL